MIVELGVNVFVIGAAGYSLWMLRRRKAMLRRHTAAAKGKEIPREKGLKNPNTPDRQSKTP